MYMLIRIIKTKLGQHCQIYDLDSMTSDVLKSHLACVYVLFNGFFLKVAFCYWGDCRVCDHVSVTISALKSHLTEVNVHNGIQNVA